MRSRDRFIKSKMDDKSDSANQPEQNEETRGRQIAIDEKTSEVDQTEGESLNEKDEESDGNEEDEDDKSKSDEDDDMDFQKKIVKKVTQMRYRRVSLSNLLNLIQSENKYN